MELWCSVRDCAVENKLNQLSEEQIVLPDRPVDQDICKDDSQWFQLSQLWVPFKPGMKLAMLPETLSESVCGHKLQAASDQHIAFREEGLLKICGNMSNI